MVSQKSKELSQEFKAAVNKEIDYSGEHPEHYRLKNKDLRQSLVRRFPYAIFYLVEENQKRVIILGLLHTSRNPEIIRKSSSFSYLKLEVSILIFLYIKFQLDPL